jgi:hypothetical protein
VGSESSHVRCPVQVRAKSLRDTSPNIPVVHLLWPVLTARSCALIARQRRSGRVTSVGDTWPPRHRRRPPPRSVGYVGRRPGNGGGWVGPALRPRWPRIVQGDVTPQVKGLECCVGNAGDRRPRGDTPRERSSPERSPPQVSAQAETESAGEAAGGVNQVDDGDARRCVDPPAAPTHPDRRRAGGAGEG